MTAMLNLMIVRHAQSTGNASGRWPRQDDSSLTEVGRYQACLLRSRLHAEGYSPTHIYSSPLERAAETARLVSQAWGLSIKAWDDLIENDGGVFAGLTWPEIEMRHPAVVQEFTTTWRMNAVPAAETHAQLRARAKRVVDKVIGEHDNDDRTLIVSHAGTMNYLVGSLLGTDRLWTMHIRNTTIFEFAIDVDKWHQGDRYRGNSSLQRINRFNDASHLGE